MNEVPAGTGVPFPENNNPRREQETKLAFILAAKPSCVGFSFYSLAIKKKKKISLKRDVCHGNHPSVPGRVSGFVTPRQIFAVETWFQWRTPPAGSGGTFVYRLRILHAPLALFLFHVG